MKALLAAVLLVVPGSACVFGQDDAPRPFGSLVRSIGGDVTRLVTREPAIVLALGGGLAVLAKQQDAGSLRAMTRSHRLEEALDAGDVAGNGYTHAGAAFAVYVLGAATRSPKVEYTGADLIEAQAVSGILTLGLKVAVRRTRPNGAHYSFPSGHSSAAFATADVLEQHFGWKAGVPAYIGAAYIGASRIADHQHYLSDVVFGSAIGIASARTLSFAHHGHQVRIAPAATAGGAALVISIIPLPLR